MLYSALNENIPGKTKLYVQSFFSYFIPFIPSPPLYHWEMRRFLNAEPFQHDTPFAMNRLEALLAIYKRHPSFQAEQLLPLQTLTDKQIQQITTPELIRILADTPANPIINSITSRLEDEQKIEYARSTALTIDQQLQAANGFIHLLPNAVRNTLSWCLSLAENCMWSIRKNVLSYLTPCLRYPQTKELVSRRLIHTAQEAKLLFPEPDYQALWKPVIHEDLPLQLAAEEKQFPLPTKQYFITLDMDEKIDILGRALIAKPDTLIPTLENFLQLTPDNQRSLFLKKLIDKADNNEQMIYKKIVYTLLNGGIDPNLFKTTRLGILASYYYSEDFFEKTLLCNNISLTDYQKIIKPLDDDIANTTLPLPVKVQNFALTKLINMFHEAIINTKKFHHYSHFSSVFLKIVTNSSLNPHRKPSEDLKILIDETSAPLVAANPPLKEWLTELHRIYLLKESNAELAEYLNKEKIRNDKQERKQLELIEKQNDFYKKVKMGVITMIAVQRVAELFPDKPLATACQDVARLGIGIFDGRDIRMKNAAIEDYQFGMKVMGAFI